MASTVPDAIRTSEKPSKVRYWVIFFAVTLSIITYIDRVAISLSRGKIAADLHLNDVQMGWVFFAFAAAYAAFEIPSGFLGDKLGPRSVLMRIVIWWSFFTAVTGAAFNLVSLFITQVLFGAGEAGCYPNITRAFSNWLPQSERVRSQGILWLSARWGGALTPLLLVFLFRYMTWRQAFPAFGLLGVVWAVAFYFWFRDDPRDKPGVNQAELDLLKYNVPAGSHKHVPWKKYFRSKTVWLLCGQYAALSFPWYFWITWAPTFIDEHHVNAASTFMKVLPLFFGGLGSIVSGLLSGPITRLTGDIALTRRILACTGFVSAACCLVMGTILRDPYVAVLAVAFSSFCNDLVMPTAWGTVMDVAGGYSGTLSGAMNMSGNAAGALFGPIAGWVLTRTHHNWNDVLFMGAAVYLTGFVMWLMIDPVTPIDRSEMRVHI